MPSKSKSKSKSRNTASQPPLQSQPPPVIVAGPNFTIYGEIHNHIDNRFYQQLHETIDNSSTRILVEKTTHEPFLQTDFITLDNISKDGKTSSDKKQIQKRFVDEVVKGSEWIYLNRIIDEQPVERIDIRVASGFPSASEEQSCFEVHGDDPVLLIKYIEHVLDVAQKRKQHFDKPSITEMYETLMQMIPLQLDLFIDNLTKVKPPMIDEDNLHNICTNLKYLSALLVDSHLLNIILENNQQTTPKQLAIFVGARHALNLYEMFLKPNGVSELEIQKTPAGNEIEIMKPQISDLIAAAKKKKEKKEEER
jgi:hypothetical protein